MSESERKTLRMVHLPPSLDELVRVMAFWEKKMKSDVICELIAEGLAARASAGLPVTVDTYIHARREGQPTGPKKPFRPKVRPAMKRPRNVRGPRKDG